jgi:hypothetical protein
MTDEIIQYLFWYKHALFTGTKSISGKFDLPSQFYIPTLIPARITGLL